MRVDWRNRPITAALALAATTVLYAAYASSAQLGSISDRVTQPVEAAEEAAFQTVRFESNRVGTDRSNGDGSLTAIDPEHASKTRTAASLRHEAARLYADRSRWEDVAVYHAHAALLSGFRGPAAASDLTLAGNLFWQGGERRLACAVLRKAGLAALRNGDFRDSDRAFRQARRVGSADCDRDLVQKLAERFVAAPTAVRVEAPEIDLGLDAKLREVEIRSVLRRPELPELRMGTMAVRMPPAPAPLRVEPPTLELPELEEVEIAPDLRHPASVGATASNSGRR